MKKKKKRKSKFFCLFAHLFLLISLLPLFFYLGTLKNNSQKVEQIFKIYSPPYFPYHEMYESLWKKIVEEKSDWKKTSITQYMLKTKDKKEIIRIPKIFNKGQIYT
ncbi:MAG: hypothetical protein U9532_00800 ['Conium maculatum' witches'-broom phytoplasma]|nr:hypothetical protein ['Conium maculatum' witches'-broom phytoplasma]